MWKADSFLADFLHCLLTMIQMLAPENGLVSWYLDPNSLDKIHACKCHQLLLCNVSEWNALSSSYYLTRGTFPMCLCVCCGILNLNLFPKSLGGLLFSVTDTVRGSAGWLHIHNYVYICMYMPLFDTPSYKTTQDWSLRQYPPWIYFLFILV